MINLDEQIPRARQSHQDSANTSARQPWQRTALSTALIACVPTALLLGCASTAFLVGPPGKRPPETASARVALADLDMSTLAGTYDAHTRLAAAAMRLCYRFEDERRVSSRETYAECVHESLKEAEQRLQASIVARPAQLGQRDRKLGSPDERENTVP